MAGKANSRSAKSIWYCEDFKIIRRMISRQIGLLLLNQACACSVRMLPPKLRTSGTLITLDRDVVCQLPPQAGKPRFVAACLKRPAYASKATEPLDNVSCATAVDNVIAQLSDESADKKLGLRTSQTEMRDVYLTAHCQEGITPWRRALTQKIADADQEQWSQGLGKP